MGKGVNGAKKLYRVPAPFERAAWVVRGAGFLKAATVISEQFANADGTPKSENLGMMVPCLVCDTFAIETFLKILSFDFGRLPYATHDLVALYEDLPSELRSFIAATWTAREMPEINAVRPHYPSDLTVPHSFEQALALGASAFVDWRYGRIGSPWWLRGLAYLLLQIITKEAGSTALPATPPAQG